MNKKIIIVLSIVIISLIGVIVYQSSLKPKTANCCQTDHMISQSTAKWNIYKKDSYGIEVKYPATFNMRESDKGEFLYDSNLFQVSFTASYDYQNGTDFILGFVDILVSPNTSSCYSLSPNGQPLSAIININGVNFHYNPSQPIPSDSMGGERGKDLLYAAIYNNRCYRVGETYVYRDKRGFTDPPYPPHFDEQKIASDLLGIINTIKIKSLAPQSSPTDLSLAVLSPNGGETFKVGSTQNITWKAPQFFRATYADLKLIPGPIECPYGYVCEPNPIYLIPRVIAEGVSIDTHQYNWKVGTFTNPEA